MALATAGLELVLPNGTTRYIALGTAADVLSDSFTEVTDSGYSRKGHSAWVTEVTGAEVRRKNNGAIVFDAFVEGVKDVTFWGIFDADVGGNLLAYGPLLNLSAEPEPQIVDAGNQPRFSDGELRLYALPEAV